MEIQILSEPEAAPFPGFRYHLIISPGMKCISNYVFDHWIDALSAAIEEWREDWEPTLSQP